jgi:hypothetical protein
MTTTNILPHGGRPVDAEQLEALGKQAAHMAEAGSLSLNDAVVQTIKHAQLGAEQIRRVVEYTNVEAFNQKFAALTGSFRAVHIDGGPADPTHVIQALGQEARPKDVVIESMEFSMPPSFDKISSAEASWVPYERTPRGALMEILALQSKLAAAHEEVTSGLEANRYLMNEAMEDLAARVKTAALEGATADEVYAAWHRVDPELTKVAFARLGRVLPAAKVAGERRINPEHPVVAVFADFVKAAHIYGGYDTARQSLEKELARVDTWLSSREV